MICDDKEIVENVKKTVKMCNILQCINNSQDRFFAQ